LGPDDDDSYGSNRNTPTNHNNFNFDIEPPLSGGTITDLNSQDTNTNEKTSLLDPYSETDFGNMNNRDRDDLFDKKPEGTASFFSQPGILAGIDNLSFQLIDM